MANIYLNAKKDLTAATATTLYTTPSNSRAIVKSLLVAEDAGTGAQITVTLVNASSDIFMLFSNKAVSGNETLQLLTEPLIMQESEILKVKANNANKLHVVASILEINREDR